MPDHLFPGERLTVLLCCLLHACYLLVAMFLAAFLHVPMTSRIFLLLLVPMNALSELQEGSSLHFGALTVLLTIFVLGTNQMSSFVFRTVQGRPGCLFLRRKRNMWQA